MRNKRMFLILLSAFACPLIFFLGLLQPQLVLLDWPFGLAFYAADVLGKWQQGLMWSVNHRFLAIFCWLAWPLLVSFLLSYVSISIASWLWHKGKHSRWYAILFLVIAISLILMVRVEPAAYYTSYYGYWTANY
jgi:predicted neutral ceramidase superfamily lipid hydrolase